MTHPARAIQNLLHITCDPLCSSDSGAPLVPVAAAATLDAHTIVDNIDLLPACDIFKLVTIFCSHDHQLDVCHA
jgi:hypothetical protein